MHHIGAAAVAAQKIADLILQCRDAFVFQARFILGVAAGTMQQEIDAALIGVRFIVGDGNTTDAGKNCQENYPNASTI